MLEKHLDRRGAGAGAGDFRRIADVEARLHGVTVERGGVSRGGRGRSRSSTSSGRRRRWRGWAGEGDGAAGAAGRRDGSRRRTAGCRCRRRRRWSSWPAPRSRRAAITELTTPTGAAILAASVRRVGRPPMRSRRGLGRGRPRAGRIGRTCCAWCRRAAPSEADRTTCGRRGQRRRHESRAGGAAVRGAVRRRRARRLVHADRHEEGAAGAVGRARCAEPARAARWRRRCSASRPPSACATRPCSARSCRAHRRGRHALRQVRSSSPGRDEPTNVAPEYEVLPRAGPRRHGVPVK